MLRNYMDLRDAREKGEPGMAVLTWPIKKIRIVGLTPLPCLLPVFALCQSPDRNVSVLYAGSLASVMENGIGPAFAKATGYTYQGEAQGSLGAAQLMRNRLRTPDVFVSADPLVNTNLLIGPQNGNLVKWFVVVASSQLVIAYNPRSKFAAKLDEAAANKTPWYDVLAIPSLRFGR